MTTTTRTHASPTRLAAQLSTGTDTWTTPPNLFAALDTEFGFVLDAAALDDTKTCGAYYGPDHADPTRRDALDADWAAEAFRLGGAVWLNPPYSHPLQRTFIAKAWEECTKGATVVLLIPSRTETAAWHEYCFRGEVRFLRGRLRFGNGSGTAPFSSAVVVFRPEGQSSAGPA